MMFVVVLTGLALIRSGVRIVRVYPDPLDTYPIPLEGASALSYGSRSLARILGWEFPDSFVVISAVLSIVAVIVLGFLLRPSRFGADGRIIAVIILLGPWGQVLLTQVGAHDVWLLLGGLVLGVLGARVSWAVAGAIIMVAGNPEQAVFASGCVLMLSFSPWLRQRRTPSFVAFSVTLAAMIGLSLAAHLAGATSRSGYLITNLGSSLYNFGANLPLTLYAAYGISWIILGWVAVRSTRGTRWILITTFLVVPLGLSAVTLDQTRVAVSISAAAVVAMLVEAVPRMRSEARASGFRNPLAWTLVGALLLPAVVVTFTGTVVVPHLWFFEGVVPSIKSLLGGLV